MRTAEIEGDVRAMVDLSGCWQKLRPKDKHFAAVLWERVLQRIWQIRKSAASRLKS
jgi:hypothetical protein